MVKSKKQWLKNYFNKNKLTLFPNKLKERKNKLL
jgi:hypothetical protein